jgi:hypothetical protein
MQVIMANFATTHCIALLAGVGVTALTAPPLSAQNAKITAVRFPMDASYFEATGPNTPYQIATLDKFPFCPLSAEQITPATCDTQEANNNWVIEKVNDTWVITVTGQGRCKATCLETK